MWLRRTRWLCGLKCRSAAVSFLGSLVRTPIKASTLVFSFLMFCVDSSLCDGLFTLSEETYRVHSPSSSRSSTVPLFQSCVSLNRAHLRISLACRRQKVFRSKPDRCDSTLLFSRKFIKKNFANKRRCSRCRMLVRMENATIELLVNIGFSNKFLTGFKWSVALP